MANPPSEAQYQAVILMEIGEQDNTVGPVAKNITVLWNMQAFKADGDIDRQYLLCKLKAIDITMGAIYKGEYQRVGGIQKDALDDKTSFLLKLRDEVKEELANLSASFNLNLDFIEPEPTY